MLILQSYTSAHVHVKNDVKTDLNDIHNTKFHNHKYVTSVKVYKHLKLQVECTQEESDSEDIVKKVKRSNEVEMALVFHQQRVSDCCVRIVLSNAFSILVSAFVDLMIKM